MKVGIYIGDASPEVGGGFTIVNEILKVLWGNGVPSNHEFVVLSTAKDQPARSRSGIEVIHLPISNPLVRRVERKILRGYLRAVRGRYQPDGSIEPNPAVERLLTSRKIDLIWYPSAWECCTLEIPFMTVVWDLQHRLQPFFPEVSEDGKWAYRERWFSTVLQRAALVIVGTAAGREEVERFYGVPRARTRIVPHPTPAFVGQHLSDASVPVVAGDYLFYPAQFWPHKNHAGLLSALHALRAAGSDLSLVLTGSDQGNAPYIKSLAAEMGLEKAVHFLGFVPEAKLVSLYQNAVALTYVTFFGPENLPPLEAFAAGCPVIASDVPGAREQLGDAALLVDPTRPDEIAAAIQAVRGDDKLRARLIKAGHDRALRSTPEGFVRSVVEWLDGFETTRRCWPPGVYQASRGR